MRGLTKPFLLTLTTVGTTLAMLVGMSGGALAATTNTLPSSGGMLIGNTFYSFSYISENNNIVQNELNTAGMSNVVLDLGGSIANLAAFIQSGNVSNTSFTTYASTHPATIPSGVIIDDVQNGVMVTSTYAASTNSVTSSSSTTPTNMMISNFQVYPDSIDHNATMTGTLISNGTPLANTTVNVTATNGGTVPTSITTDANGNFSFTYTTSQTSGTVNDTVDFHINGVLISTEPVDYAVGSIILVGTYPERVAYDTTNKDVYVTNQFAAGQSSGNGTVSVINGNTNKVIATVSIGNAPNGNAHAITCDSANGNVYVTNQFAAGQSSGNGTVSVINGSTNEVIATIPAGQDPDGVAYDATNGDVYVANYGSNTVSVINGSTNEVVATVPVGNTPFAVAYDSKNEDVYVANYDTISVIDGSSNTVVATVKVGAGGPCAVASNYGNGDVYVVNIFNGTVSVINGSSNAVVTTIPTGQGPDGVVYDSTSGDMYVTNNGDGTISVINGSTDTVVSTVSVGGNPDAITYDANNDDVYVAGVDNNTISVIPAFGSVFSSQTNILQTLSIGATDSAVQTNSNTNVSGLTAQTDASGIALDGVGADSGHNAQLADIYVEPQNGFGHQGGAMNQSTTYNIAVSNGGQIYSVNGVAITPTSALVLFYTPGTGYQVDASTTMIPSMSVTNPLWITGGAQGALPEDFEIGVINGYTGATTMTVASGGVSSTASIIYNEGGGPSSNAITVNQTNSTSSNFPSSTTNNSSASPILSVNDSNGTYSIGVSNVQPYATVIMYTSNGMMYAAMTANSAGTVTLNNVSSGSYYAIQTWNGKQSAPSNWVST